MPGLVPGILFSDAGTMREGFLYMTTNRPHGVLYTGVTSDLSRRVYEHREGLIRGFTSRYGLTRLVNYETFPMVTDAIQREKNIKHWPRIWKVKLIEAMNPDWRDLYEELL
jgi:putative endonuclease